MDAGGAPWARENAGTLSVVFGGMAWLLLLTGWAMGRGALDAALLVPALLLAILAIVFGALGMRTPEAAVGGTLGRTLAVTGLVLGIVYLGFAFLLPLLLLLLFLLFGASFACGSAGSGSSPPPQRPCCDPAPCCAPCTDGCEGCCGQGASGSGGCCGGCGEGCCGGCDCGGCDCGGCGGCGGCGCAALAVGPWAARATEHAPPGIGLRPTAFAHHPDAPGFEHDVYRVGAWRLCVGCFTTYPVFLLVVAALLPFAPVPGPWWAWAGGGLLAALGQTVSSAGLAKRRWMKATVKTLLGAGLAAFLHGVLASPLPRPLQAGLLLAALAGAWASAIPRARRMREARRAAAQGGPCACQARREKAA